MRAQTKERAVARIGELAGRGLDLVGFWDEAAEAVSSAIPHYMAPCWFTLDPASLLVTSHYDHGQIPELPPEWNRPAAQSDTGRQDRLVPPTPACSAGGPEPPIA